MNSVAIVIGNLPGLAAGPDALRQRRPSMHVQTGKIKGSVVRGRARPPTTEKIPPPATVVRVAKPFDGAAIWDNMDQ